MEFIEAHLNQLAAILGVAAILGIGRNVILPAVRGSKFLLWVAFIVTAICGLILGWALVAVAGWLTGITSIGGFSIAGIVAVLLGWHAVGMAVDMVRDLLDGQPDDEARSAALWVPTLMPAGWSAVWAVASNPRGLGTGITAAIMAGITIGYASVISKKAVKGKKGKAGWLWFAAAVCLLGGLAATPLLLYVDGWIASMISGGWLFLYRAVAGAVGVGLALAALKDIVADKRPDEHVRRFLQFGLPLVFAFGAIALGLLAGAATDGAEVLNGVA